MVWEPCEVWSNEYNCIKTWSCIKLLNHLLSLIWYSGKVVDYIQGKGQFAGGPKFKKKMTMPDNMSSQCRQSFDPRPFWWEIHMQSLEPRGFWWEIGTKWGVGCVKKQVFFKELRDHLDYHFYRSEWETCKKLGLFDYFLFKILQDPPWHPD